MIDETDLSQEREWFYDTRARRVINNLQKRHMNGQYVSSRKEALATVLKMIPPGAIVARGDSLSVDQVGVIPELKKRNQNTLIDPFERDADGLFIASPEERDQMQRQTFFADIFLTGTNAITLDGQLVNIDGLGNRVAAIIFGPKKVIIVMGINKLVKDLDQALERIHNFAAPLNAKRHYLRHHRPEYGELPCVRTGICVDCSHEQRICRYTVITEGTTLRQKGRINVVLVGEELGI